MDDIIKPGLVLLLITVVAAVCLGFVYNITKEPIEMQKQTAKAESMKTLLPDASEFKDEIKPEDGSLVQEITTGYANGDINGYVLLVAPKGYAGSIEMLVGIDTEGVLTGISIVNHSETPGLGANCENDSFKNQFVGKSGLINVTKGEPGADEIQALTSATITSKAVTAGVNEALDYFEYNIK